MSNLYLNPDKPVFGSNTGHSFGRIEDKEPHIESPVSRILSEAGLAYHKQSDLPARAVVLQNVSSLPTSGWFRYTEPTYQGLTHGKLEGVAGGFFMGGKVRGELLSAKRGWQTMHGFVPHLEAADAKVVIPTPLDFAADELIAEAMNRASTWAATAFSTPEDLRAAQGMIPQVRVITTDSDYFMEWGPVQRTVDGPCVILNSQARSGIDGHLWAEIWLYAYNDLTQIEFELLVGYSSPDHSELAYECSLNLCPPTGMGCRVMFPTYHGLDETYGTSGQLWQNISFGDAQAQGIRGFLRTTVPPYPRTDGYIVAVSNAWRYPGKPLDKGQEFRLDTEGGLGVLGFTPYPYADQNQSWSSSEEMLRKRFAPRILTKQGYWDYPGIGLHAASGDTGDQDDFHVLMAPEVFGCSYVPFPAPILEYWHAASCEARRPNHFRGRAGRRLILEAHPEWVTFSGYTHHSSSVSPDRLGKGPAQWMYWSGNWRGPDREHWSNNRLCTAFWLTGSYLLESLIQDQALLFLSGETIDLSLPTSHAGAARGIGRTCWAALNILLSLADGDQLGLAMLVRLQQRLILVHNECYKRTDMPIRPLVVMDPHPNNLRGRCKFWTPWEHSVGIIGLYGCASPGLMDSSFACDLLHQSMQAVVREGWLDSLGAPGTIWDHCKAVEWLDGQTSGEQETYSGYNRWGSVLIALASKISMPGGLPEDERNKALQIARFLVSGNNPSTAADPLSTWHQACQTILNSLPILIEPRQED